MIHFLKNLMIAGGLLQVAAFGAGKFSIDAQLDQRRGYFRARQQLACDRLVRV
jgi:hypothetical protein